MPPGWDVFEETQLQIRSDALTEQAVSFLDDPSSDPFFLYVAYRDPHAYAAKRVLPQYRSAVVPLAPRPPNDNEVDLSDKPAWVRALPKIGLKKSNKWRLEREAAQRALLGVDDGLQQIVDELATSGRLDNTLIVFVSDNGYSWGSHRHLGKECGYDECNRVPLLIRYPELGANRDDLRFVSNADLAPTIAEYAGVTPGIEPNGRSLVPVITETPVAWDQAVLLERTVGDFMDYWGIRVPGWSYIEYLNGDESSTT